MAQCSDFMGVHPKTALPSKRVPFHLWTAGSRFGRWTPFWKPTYGDCTTVRPDFVARDMRKIRAAGKVIHTTADASATRKGGAFPGEPSPDAPPLRGNHGRQHVPVQGRGLLVW